MITKNSDDTTPRFVTLSVKVSQLLLFILIWSAIPSSTRASHSYRISPPEPYVYTCLTRQQRSSESTPSCVPNPCKNGGRCINEGDRLSCKCPAQYGGATCEEYKGECVSYGGTHYITFNKQRFDFVGSGRYILSEDCVGKTYQLSIKTDYCGTRSCLMELQIQFKGNDIRFYRGRPEISVNDKKYIATRTMCGIGFTLRRMPPMIILTTDFGLEIEWNGDRTIRVFLLERYKGKTCGLCAKYGVNDNKCGAKGKCNENPGMSGFCQPGREDVVNKCDLMSTAPFQTCNSSVDASTHVRNCKFDACRCDDPWECVCSAFATYSKDCADSGKVLSWRSGENAYKPLSKCAKTCSSQQVFTECGSSCVKACLDLASSAPCNETCVAECQCPKDQLLNDQGKCISENECPCYFGKKEIAPGNSINNGTCKTCTCKRGLLECNDCVEEAKCEGTKAKLDLLLVVDGSGSVLKANFAKIKIFVQNLTQRFEVGSNKTRIALMQFGEPVKTRIEFNLGDKNTLDEVNEGVENMTYLRSQTATGDALRKAREQVFNGTGGDRLNVSDVLMLFTDGQATDKRGKKVQVEEAQKLKDNGVKIITVAMGREKTIAKFRDKLREMASKFDDSDERLQFEADFGQLESLSNVLVITACNSTTSG